MNVMTGYALKEYATKKAPEYFKKRFCFEDLNEFCTSENDMQVMALYGLRRTGKSTLMCQQIIELNDYDNTVWMQCDGKDDMQDIKDVIFENKDKKYFFIDEITKVSNFIQTASVLSDIYAVMDKKIIFSGTDSLGIYQVEGEELLDRMHKISTTYIPYKEFNHLFEDKGLEDYIKHGGTLTNGNTFYNKDNVDLYTNSAIARNIEHSLEHTGRGGEFGILSAMYDADEFTSFINKIVELHNRTFLLKTIRKSFISHDMGSLKNFIEKGKLPIADPKPLYDKNFLSSVEKALEIKDELTITPTPDMVKQANKYLQALDVILPLPDTDEVIFTQPGIRYAQMEKQIEMLMLHPIMKEAYNVTEREALAVKLRQDIQGQLLEDIIFYQLYKDNVINKEFYITKYQERVDDRMHEFDIVLESKKKNESVVLEVKHSKTETEEQRVHLENKNFCDFYQKDHKTTIKGKAVIYMGEDKVLSNGISYLNAAYFLKASKKALKSVVQAFQLTIIR